MPIYNIHGKKSNVLIGSGQKRYLQQEKISKILINYLSVGFQLNHLLKATKLLESY